MTECAIELHGKVPILIGEVKVPTEISLRDGLSTNLTVTGITGINGTIVVEVRDDVLTILVDTLAVRQVEDADRLSFHEVGNAIVLCQSGSIDTCHHNMLRGGQLLSLIRSGERVELVALEAEVQSRVEGEVLCADDVATDADFEAVVGHLTHVGQQVLIGKRRYRHRVGVEQILGLRGIPVEGNIESAVESREVETDIEGMLCLPLQVGIVVALYGKSRRVAAIDRCHTIRTIERQRSIRVNGILITCDAISDANLEVVNPVDILHKALLRKHPRGRSRWEPAPLMATAEL